MIHPQTTIGTVHLNVRDIEKVTDFYRDMLGFTAQPSPKADILLTVEERPLFALHHTPDAPPRQRTTGLFHAAILLPSRADLSRFLYNLAERGYPLQGASDHLVSEALYLADPEGNGLEVYRDRPRDAWPVSNGRLRMATDPLDINRLVSEADGPWQGMPPGTTMGHIHLSVDDISAAEGFYRDIIGFDVMVRYGAQATFMSAGGYHHHIGANVWNSFNAPPAPEGSLGLRHWEIDVPAPLDELHSRLEAAQVPLTAANGSLTVTDPAGIRLEVVTTL